YEALSYTRHNENIVESTASIRCQRRTVGVTCNCELALQYSRCQNRDRCLWIVSICIKQSGKTERGLQVEIMGNIYSKVSKVVVWLVEA
ncbi:heterokaryon incompatibility, partial [Rhexocercosporidium sp. MPI-PUGE-AT-0058]